VFLRRCLLLWKVCSRIAVAGCGKKLLRLESFVVGLAKLWIGGLILIFKLKLDLFLSSITVRFK
jgi:hypothetical protein